MIRRLTGLLVVAALTLLTPPVAAADLGDRLVRGQTMHEGDVVHRYAALGYYLLELQYDGNLVLYYYPDQHYSRRVCWAAGTVGPKTTRAVYQTDGNFVVYAGPRPLWASGTANGPGTTVTVNQYGQLYVGGRPISAVCGS